MNISAAAVKTLRDRTNQPMMDCKAALTEASGDMEKAVDILRKKSKDVQDKKVGRETAEGRIAAYIDPTQKVGALLELRCESAPVAKGSDFAQLANDIAKQIALKSPATVQELLAQPYVDDSKHTVADRISDAVGRIREKIVPARFVRMTGLLGSYIHHDFAQGAMVQAEGAQADLQVLRDTAVHITAKNPVAARREDISPETLAKEKEIAKSQAAATGKPENLVEKIAEGKMKTWFAENVLLEQPFVKDESKNPKTVGDLLKAAGLKLIKFVRFKVGELS
jgi:elongation factor Ts